jgi:hypothetical protein
MSDEKPRPRRLMDARQCYRCGQFEPNHERHGSPGCPGVYPAALKPDEEAALRIYYGSAVGPDDFLRLLATLDAVRAERDAAIERAERLERMQASSYELLKAYDNYGSGDVSTCYREMLRILTADHPQAFDALQREVDRMRAVVEAARDMIAGREREPGMNWMAVGFRDVEDLQDALRALDDEKA